MRDEAVQWSIVDALTSELALRRMTKREQRQLIKHRLAQAHRIEVADIANGRNTTLNCAVTRIYYLANPRGEAPAAELAEARRRGVGFLKCYSIANGRTTLAEIEQSTSPPQRASNVDFVSPNELHGRFHAVIMSAINSGLFIDEITQAFEDALAAFPNGTDLREVYSETDH